MQAIGFPKCGNGVILVEAEVRIGQSRFKRLPVPFFDFDICHDTPTASLRMRFLLRCSYFREFCHLTLNVLLAVARVLYLILRSRSVLLIIVVPDISGQFLKSI